MPIPDTFAADSSPLPLATLRKLIRRATAIAVVATIFLLQTARAGEEEARIFDDFQRGCREYAELFHRTPGHIRHTTSEGYDRKISTDTAPRMRTESVYKYDRRHNSVMFTSENLLNKGGGRVLSSCTSINSKYCFELSKWDGNKPWVLSKCIVTSDPDVDTNALGFEGPYTRPSRWPVFTGEGYIASFNRLISPGDLRDLKGYVLISATKLPADETKVAIEFKYAQPAAWSAENPKKPPVVATTHSRLVCDASHYHVPLELSESTTAHGELYKYSVKCEYEFEAGKPVRKTSRTTTKVTAGQRTLAHDESIDTNRYEFHPVPESEFTLSAYGFPEPPGIDWNSRRIPAYMWALAVGGVCLAGYFILRRRTAHQLA